MYSKMNISFINKPKNYDLLFNTNLFNNVIIDPEDSDNFNKISDQTEICIINIDTDINRDGSCNFENIQKSISNIRNISFNKEPSIFLISKVPPGICNKLGCHYLPFLNNKGNLDKQEKILVGINYNDPFAENAMKKIQQLFTSLKNENVINTDKLLFLKNKELEIIEISKQSYFATKIAFFSEINEYCNKQDINYRKIREYLELDNNIESSYTNVLGSDNKPGFSGNSMMKNLLFISDDIKNLGVTSHIIDNVIKRNVKKDRPILDWLRDPKNDLLDEEISKLKSNTLGELHQYCTNYNIDINDCVERSDVIDKIIAFKKKNYYTIPILNDNPVNNIPDVIPNAFNMRQSINPNISNTTNINSEQSGFQPPSIQGQSGVPIQINQPPIQMTNTHNNIQNNQQRKPIFRPGGRNLLNMNVRSNNTQMWGNTRPGTRTGGGGGIRFGGGVQR